MNIKSNQSKQQTTMKKQNFMPHESWYKYYDYVNETAFGRAYDMFNETSLRAIQSIVPTGSTILDFGAGTGRLSLPLCDLGYNPVAIERCQGMLNVLQQKMKAQGKGFPVYNCSIAEYKGGEKGDLALAVFTVLEYITDEQEMRASLRNISEHLNDGGYFLFDLAGACFFDGSFDKEDVEGIYRHTSIRKTSQPNVYQYFEECTGTLNGEDFEYSDSFLLRDWKLEELDAMLNEVGLVNTGVELSELNDFGSAYRLYQKIAKNSAK